jgi:hypothetical protein
MLDITSAPDFKCDLAPLATKDDRNEATPLNLQVSRLTRRCGVDAGMAETLAPMVFGGAR